MKVWAGRLGFADDRLGHLGRRGGERQGECEGAAGLRSRLQADVTSVLAGKLSR